MRSHFAKDILIAVSANNKETALNTEQALDTGMLCDIGSIPNIDARRENNAEEATGKEEPDTIYDLGGVSNMEMVFPKCQSQHMAFIGSFGLGAISSGGAGATGYKHTIVPITGDLDSLRSNPSFTLGARLGKRLEKRRFGSMLVDSFTLRMARDSWVELRATLRGTGKNDSNLLKDEIQAAFNTTSLTLTKAVAGADAQERLDNCHHIRVLDPVGGQWIDVVFTAVSDGSPAVVTIVAPGGEATQTAYEVIYNQAETGDFAWCSFPNRINEPPLRVSDFLVNIGGKWDGSTLTGGHILEADINSFEWAYSQGLAPDFTPGGGTYSYANRALREGRTQTISIDRRFMDFIMGQRFKDLETFVFYAKAEGPEYESGHKYTIEIIFPKVAARARPVAREGNRLSEKIDLDVFQDDTYGSVILMVKNKVATYAA